MRITADFSSKKKKNANQKTGVNSLKYLGKNTVNLEFFTQSKYLSKMENKDFLIDAKAKDILH